MFNWLTAWARFKKGRRQACTLALAVADTERLPEPLQAEGKSSGCLQRLAAAPWGRLLLGDDPVSLGVLLVFTLLLQPLVRGVEIGLLVLFAAAALLRAWLWCRDTRRTNAA
jgi:hypothetical protein